MAVTGEKDTEMSFDWLR